MLEGPARYACLAGGTRSGKTFLIVRAIVSARRSCAGIASCDPALPRQCRESVHCPRHAAACDETLLPACGPEGIPPGRRLRHEQRLADLTIGGLDDDERVEKILGLEYASVFLNEASQIPYESALIAFTRLAQVVPASDAARLCRLESDVEDALDQCALRRETRSRSRASRLKANPDVYARAFLNPRDNAANLSAAFIASLEALARAPASALLRRRLCRIAVDGCPVELRDRSISNRCEAEFHRQEKDRKLSGGRARPFRRQEHATTCAPTRSASSSPRLARTATPTSSPTDPARIKAEGWARRAVDRVPRVQGRLHRRRDQLRRRHGRPPRSAPRIRARAGARGDREPRQGGARRADLAALRQGPGAPRRTFSEGWRSQLCAFTGGGYHGARQPRPRRCRDLGA